MKFSKKLLSMVLAGALAISASVTAFAVDKSTVITGEYQDIEIEVNVPTTGAALINPYSLPLENVTLGGSNFAELNAGQQIFTVPMVVENKTKIDLDVSASLSDTTATGLTLASEAPERDATTKSAFVYFQMAPTNETTLANVEANDYYATAKWPAYSANKCLVLQNAKESKFDTETVLATIKGVDAATLAPQAGSLAMFRLTGSCVKAPKTPWATSDTFSTKVVFTFAPSETTAP